MIDTSKLVIDESIIHKYDAVWKDLKSYYILEGHKLPNQELMVKIDILFGHELIKLVDEPLKYLNGAGAFLATVLLRQSIKMDELNER